MTDELTEAKIAEAANAAATASEASSNATQVQLESLLKTNQQETYSNLVRAIREVLTTGDEGTKKLLIQKIPLLCTDILTMKGDIVLIKSIGKYILIAMGGLFVTLIGNLLLKGL